MTSLHALIIDDEPDICELLQLTLQRMQVSADTAGSLAQAKQLLEQRHYNLCLTDMKLPDGNGIDMVRWINLHQSQLPVAVITAHGNTDTAVEAMKAGAFDFISKPVELASLRKLVAAAIDTSQLNQQSQINNTGLFGRSAVMQQLETSVRKLARSQAPVYIFGESGSGKELAARSIHQLGPRAQKPFVPVNCGAIPKELMESEFFGHKKGTFTGAHQDKMGLFKAAEGGTLFLDEVADLPLDMQVKLLRAIQEKAIRVVGGASEETIDVRILSATHKNLEKEVEAGTFRQDLFYRLNVIQLKVPALRERTEDISDLCQLLLAKIAKDMQIATPKLAKDALLRLQQYEFPGNVRELENILERAFTLCEGDTIRADDLQLQNPITQGVQKRRAGDKPSGGGTDHFARALEYDSIDEYLAEIEKEVLMGALEKVRWNKTLAAKELNITFRSLRYRLQKLGLDDD
jgi:two-component system, NtrC family, response regulator PilR